MNAAADDSSSSSLDPNDADVAFAFADFEGVDFGEDEVVLTPQPQSEGKDRPSNNIIAQNSGGLNQLKVDYPSGQNQEDSIRAHDPELFELQRLRVKNLTLWYELGTRPDMARTSLNIKAHMHDGDLLSCTKDDLSALLVRIMEAHDEMNSNLPQHKLSDFEKDLEVRDSTIRDAGKGLFSKAAIPSGAAVCYYSGYRHTYQSQKRLRNRTYVMKLQNGWPKHDRSVSTLWSLSSSSVLPSLT